MLAGPCFVTLVKNAYSVTPTRHSLRLAASAALSSTTSRPPPSSGTRMIKLRPSLVTSIGPSPVRGFIAAIRKIPLHLSQVTPTRPAGSASQLQPAAPLGRPPWPGTFRCFVLALSPLSRNYPPVANQTPICPGFVHTRLALQRSTSGRVVSAPGGERGGPRPQPHHPHDLEEDEHQHDGSPVRLGLGQQRHPPAPAGKGGSSILNVLVCGCRKTSRYPM